MMRSRFGDPILLLTVFILYAIGCFVLYTTTPIGAEATTWIDTLFARQLLFGLFSFTLIYFLINIDLEFSRTLVIQVAMLAIIVFLLAGLFIFGPVINDTHRWYKLGQFLLQPSEFLKIVIPMWLAFWLTVSKKGEIKTFIPLIVGLVVSLSLVVLQPDFGATIIMLVIIFAVVITWGVRFKTGQYLVFWAMQSLVVIALAAATNWWVLVLLILPLIWLFRIAPQLALTAGVLLMLFGGVVGTFSYLWVNEIGYLGKESYVRKRIDSFLGESEMTPQIRQSRIAIGSGGFWGKGIAQGTQTRLRFLPEYTTDFIFATFVEERGFAGILLLFFVYTVFFARLIYLTIKIQDEYAKLVMIGLIVKLWFETFVNIGMNMGVLPTKGVALPFVSYGGSSLLANSIILGVVLSLYRSESKRDTMSPSYGLA